jgi:hypothetical protein
VVVTPVQRLEALERLIAKGGVPPADRIPHDLPAFRGKGGSGRSGGGDRPYGGLHDLAGSEVPRLRAWVVLGRLAEAGRRPTRLPALWHGAQPAEGSRPSWLPAKTSRALTPLHPPGRSLGARPAGGYAWRMGVLSARRVDDRHRRGAGEFGNLPEQLRSLQSYGWGRVRGQRRGGR